LKQVWITIVIIAPVGVLITALITGVPAYYVFGIHFIVALLLGATLASTDPATLVPIFRQVHIRDFAQTVMSESAFNDAMGAIDRHLRRAERRDGHGRIFIHRLRLRVRQADARRTLCRRAARVISRPC
jgi:Sodium/hydrogen exchanger family